MDKFDILGTSPKSDGVFINKNSSSPDGVSLSVNISGDITDLGEYPEVDSLKVGDVRDFLTNHQAKANDGRYMIGLSGSLYIKNNAPTPVRLSTDSYKGSKDDIVSPDHACNITTLRFIESAISRRQKSIDLYDKVRNQIKIKSNNWKYAMCYVRAIINDQIIGKRFSITKPLNGDSTFRTIRTKFRMTPSVSFTAICSYDLNEDCYYLKVMSHNDEEVAFLGVDLFELKSNTPVDGIMVTEGYQAMLTDDNGRILILG